MADDSTRYLRDLWTEAAIIAMKASASAGLQPTGSTPTDAAGMGAPPGLGMTRTYTTHVSPPSATARRVGLAGLWAVDAGPAALISAAGFMLVGSSVPLAEDGAVLLVLVTMAFVLLGFGFSAYALHGCWLAMGSSARRGVSPLASLLLQPVVPMGVLFLDVDTSLGGAVVLAGIFVGYASVVVAIAATWRHVFGGAAAIALFVLGLVAPGIPTAVSAIGLIGIAVWVRYVHREVLLRVSP